MLCLTVLLHSDTLHLTYSSSKSVAGKHRMRQQQHRKVPLAVYAATALWDTASHENRVLTALK